MPTYTYTCENKHRWELTRKIAERNEPTACPECGSDGRLVIVSAPTIPWWPGCTRSDYKERLRHH